ncbi:HisA/HisF-related TIM barrel protein [Synechococcus sp. 8F6]|uniref:HisA/HisF-related TIM barrel protein n=1 Tax=Synechococcus sp. 8F6 TaxID=2025606 RepID=UPI000B995DFD|nr:HisA/HisF-related TIM barrel protein [Synechococcus sp. 8F6]
MFETRKRIIPVLLLKGPGLVKTRRFRSPTYLGDPVNTVRIFNDMEVDEIVLLDISVTPARKSPQMYLLRDIAAEALFPLSYGGGVTDLDVAAQIIESGFERIVVNTACSTHPDFVAHMCNELGSSTVVGSMDVKSRWLRGQSVFVSGGATLVKPSVLDWAKRLEDLGVGEIMVNAIERDGEMIGYDLDLIRQVSNAVSVPVIACGGAQSFPDLTTAFTAGASAAAGGAVFVFKGKHRGVLIQYPRQSDRNEFL